ncbi:MAG TPA: imidazolonepropionase [Anaerolineales bacterium]|nr:imidazolonepropionase [Anaerolineales bacterium]
MTPPERADLIVHSALQLLTLAGGPQRGHQLGRLGIVPDGAVAIRDGKILAVGPSGDIRRGYAASGELDASGRIVLPGFVDSHTHPIWIGDRAAEFEMRLAGRSYMDILAAGGGIMSTVRATRAASVEQLATETRPRLRRMLAHGTTTAEVKTGYGLEQAAELRMLEAILDLAAAGPPELVPTFLAAHAVPEEYQGRTEAYVAAVCQEMLPSVQAWWKDHAGGAALPYVDVFCEQGVFDLAQSRRILTTARALGFPLKIHTDEFVALGGTSLAVELGATSADHLLHTPPEEISLMAKSETVAVLLPATPFGLGDAARGPASALLEAGGLLAIASDLNPGTAWCESMQFTIALACRSLGLTSAQAIAASTINGAAALGLAHRKGSLEPGKDADLIVLDAADFRHLGYRFGTNLVSTVVQGGRIVI